MTRPASLPTLTTWPARRWAAAAAGAAGTVLVVGVPTDLIDTPCFSREIPPTWWAWPVLVVTAALTGLLLATYVAHPDGVVDQSVRRAGGLGGVLSFFAVGCPVCNKLVLLALGTTGALRWFAPVQPVLSLFALALLGWALRRRLRDAAQCPVGPVRS